MSRQGLSPLSTTFVCFVWQETVLKEISSFNLDIPEGGFDGLVQVMACKDVRLHKPS